MIKKVFLLSVHASIFSYKAVIIKPVIDLLGNPSQELHQKLSLYNNLAYASLKNMSLCPRLFQGLYNEIVDVLEEFEHEAHVEYPSCFYQSAQGKSSSFWTLKKNLLPLDQLDAAKIPQHINYLDKIVPQSTSVIQLLEPFYDPQQKITYSACTRFVTDTAADNTTDYRAYVINPVKKTVKILIIPKKYCFKPTDNKRNDFITILNHWVPNERGFIPYVWGGGSFCYRKKDAFIKNTQQAVTYPHDTNRIKCGMDCSGMILRAAQMAGIPYFCRNTTAIDLTLEPLKKDDPIEHGDLILFKGHVIVITDVEKNMCIEARGYKDGFGKIQQMPLDKLFKNIHTVDDLKKAYILKQKLQRLDAQGNVCLIIPSIKILKLIA